MKRRERLAAKSMIQISCDEKKRKSAERPFLGFSFLFCKPIKSYWSSSEKVISKQRIVEKQNETWEDRKRRNRKICHAFYFPRFIFFSIQSFNPVFPSDERGEKRARTGRSILRYRIHGLFSHFLVLFFLFLLCVFYWISAHLDQRKKRKEQKVKYK